MSHTLILARIDLVRHLAQSNGIGKNLYNLARVHVRAIGCRLLSFHYGGEILGIGFSSD